MLVLMESAASESEIQAVVALLESLGVRTQIQAHPESTSILAPHASRALKADRIEPGLGFAMFPRLRQLDADDLAGLFVDDDVAADL